MEQAPVANGTEPAAATNGVVPLPEIPNGTVAPKEEPVAEPGKDLMSLAAPYQKLSISAQSVHADDYLSSHVQDIAPAMHVSTTYRYARNPDDLIVWENDNPHNKHASYIYSRYMAPNATRLEALLTSVLHGPALTYSTGLAAFHAMLAFLNPRRIAIGGGYHGCHGVIALMNKLTGLQVVDLDCADEELGEGDVIHVETPLNPTGEARNLAAYAAKARRTGARLTCDATFGPPPLQDPFRFGVDIVMHSGTKYIGGHSDMLCGVLAVAPRHAAEWIPKMVDERNVIGGVMGSLEGWLGVRSMRTLELRVRRQSADAEKLVRWLADEQAKEGSVVARLVDNVKHASLQEADLAEDGWLRDQMPSGFGPVFSINMRDERDARRLPSKLRLFHHATSLGGVESLIEWRSMTDRSVEKTLLRVSVGVEGFEDLRDDWQQGLEALAREKREDGGASK